MMEREELDQILAEFRKISAPAPGLDTAERLGRMIAEAADRGKEKLEAKPSTQFEWKMNFGQVVGMCFSATTTALAVGGVLWHFSAAQAETRRDIDSLLSRGAISGPKLEEVVKSNDVQNERIQNLNLAVVEIRKQGVETNSILGSMREDLATLRARAGIERQPR